MSTLLIIGGTGFFGKSILDSFNRDQLKPWNIGKIIIMSRNILNFRKDFPELINNKVELISGDISTIESLPDADYVIHAAASTNPEKYLNASEEEKKNIIAGTINYCKLALKFHKNSKIIYCSSGAVYGYQPENLKFLKETDLFGDITRLDTLKRSYAYAKRDSELAILNLGTNNLNVTIARCFTFVGKYLPKNKQFAIGNFISNGLKNEDIYVKADRPVYRSYMYADDLVRWLLEMGKNSNPKCPIYNVASDQEVEIRELANVISKIFNVRVNFANINEKMEADRYIPSIKKAQKELGLKNSISLEDSILKSF
jgi:nucleoside-diphosphate-sugar epimerase